MLRSLNRLRAMLSIFEGGNGIVWWMRGGAWSSWLLLD